jgi:hypothetical protein
VSNYKIKERTIGDNFGDRRKKDGDIFATRRKISFFTRTLNTSLIRGDGGALNTNVVLLDGLGSINGNLIIRLVTVFHAKIEVLNVNIQVREDELLKKNKR